MIKSFKSKNAEDLFFDKKLKKLVNIERVARRKLMILHAACDVNDLRVPPGNMLETLQGDRKGQYSIRINKQWRVCFKWIDGHAWDVEIVDYH